MARSDRERKILLGMETCPLIRQPKQEQPHRPVVKSLDEVFIARRKGLVDHPFGTIKRSLNQGYILTRGLPKVRTELNVTVLVYNLKRAINMRSVGVPRLIQALA